MIFWLKQKKGKFISFIYCFFCKGTRGMLNQNSGTILSFCTLKYIKWVSIDSSDILLRSSVYY